MKTEDILSHVDHTLLKAAASWERNTEIMR